MQIALVGAGGHARVVLDAARCQGLDVVVAVDDRADLHGTTLDGLPVVGGALAFDELRSRGIDAVILGVGSVVASPARMGLFLRFAEAGFRLPIVRHPRGTVASTAQLGDGTVVFAHAVVNANARIGRNVIVNTSAVVEHDCEVGDHVHISPGALLAGGVRIGAGTHIGLGAVVIQGVRIGSGAMVGAGAVVLGDVPDNVRVVGVPAVPLP